MPCKMEKCTVLVSVHDVSPRSEYEVERLRELLSREVDEARIALLVVPNYWKKSPIVQGTAFAGRLRRWAEEGNEIFLHGWSHRDDRKHRRAVDRFRAKHLTAGEGEFLGLDRFSAYARLRRGRSLLEDVTGLPVSGFVAPAWLYGSNALDALAELEFPIAEDHFAVWHPPNGRILARGPVISWASRSPMRIRASLAFARIAKWVFGPVRHVRIAVHPGDLRVARLQASIAQTLAHFAQEREVGRYADLLHSAPERAAISQIRVP